MDYWREFEKPKIVYQVIQFHPCYSLDETGALGNDKTFFIPSADLYLLAVLNSPLMWRCNWRSFQHLKDEALSPMGYMMQTVPIPAPTDAQRADAEVCVRRLIGLTGERRRGAADVLDWLKAEYAIDKPSRALADPAGLTAEALAAEVRKLRGKKHPLTVAGLKGPKDEHFARVLPLQALAAEADALERRASDAVNAAFGLTPGEVALVWQTAAPRTPRCGGGGVVSPYRSTGTLRRPRTPRRAPRDPRCLRAPP